MLNKDDFNWDACLQFVDVLQSMDNSQFNGQSAGNNWHFMLYICSFATGPYSSNAASRSSCRMVDGQEHVLGAFMEHSGKTPEQRIERPLVVPVLPKTWGHKMPILCSPNPSCRCDKYPIVGGHFFPWLEDLSVLSSMSMIHSSFSCWNLFFTIHPCFHYNPDLSIIFLAPKNLRWL